MRYEFGSSAFGLKVSAIEKSISNGVKVPEVQITTLIEMLMRQAIKLDNIAAEGDASAQKSLQVYTYLKFDSFSFIHNLDI